MLTLERWFPTVIGYKINPNHNLIEDALSKYCYDLQKTVGAGGQSWIANDTYNTSSGQHDCFEDKQFANLNNWVIECVNEYASQLQLSRPIVPQASWFNIYKKYDYQEFHTHPGAHISTIYFLKGSASGAKVYFKNNSADMLNISYTEYNSDSFTTVHHEPTPGKLLIFLSHTYHAVERHNVDDERISLSYNFLQDLK